MANRDIIIIGASSGGCDTLTKLVTQLPHNLPAPIFVVTRIAPDSPSIMAEFLAKHTSLKCA